MFNCSSGSSSGSSRRCLIINVILIILVIYSNSCYGFCSRLAHFNSIYKSHHHHLHHHHHQCNNLNIKHGRISIQKKLYDSLNNNPDDDWMDNLIEETDDDDDDDAESNAESNDFLQYLNEEYDKLKGSKKGLSFDAFIDWTEVRDVLDDEFLELDDLVEIWKNKVGSIQDQCSRTQFLDVIEAIYEAV